MTINIRLEYQELRALFDELQVQEEVFAGCIDHLNRLIKRVPDSWEGGAAEAYLARFEWLKPSFEETRRVLFVLRQQINETMLLMQERDQSLAGRLAF